MARSAINFAYKVRRGVRMAHIWVYSEPEKLWAVMPMVEGSMLEFTGEDKRPLRQSAGGTSSRFPILMSASGLPGEETSWTLLAQPDANLWVNGLPLISGIRLLRNQDEICILGCRRFYFSTDSLPQVMAFPGFDRSILCPRCKQEVKKGEPSVRCPSCGVWHHQTE